MSRSRSPRSYLAGTNRAQPLALSLARARLALALGPLVAAGAIASLSACGVPEDPPGRSIEKEAAIAPILPAPEPRPAPCGGSGPSGARFEPCPRAVDGQTAQSGAPGSGRRQDAEPGHGAKIASIAMRTWIYVAPRDRSTKLGYLRAGAVVDRAEVSAGTEGCAGGWYRIAPRGYVCVGKGASLALDHQIVQAAVRGPDRAALTPYAYVISRSPPPHLYFRLPSRKEQEHVEGRSLGKNLARFAALASMATDPVPDFLLAGRDLPKPYGSEEKLHYSVHAGKAREQSAFGLITTFEWTDRRFGLTTELDIIPLDRTRRATISALRGVVLSPDLPPVRPRDGDSEDVATPASTSSPAPLPAGPPPLLTPAFVIQQGVTKLRLDAKGVLREDGLAPFHSGWGLTGRNNGSPRGMLETSEGAWLPAEALRIAQIREDPAGYAREGKKWIDVSIKRQMLVAYEGTRPVFATLVSTGMGELGDPVKTHATIRGTFLIHSKHVSGTMDGDEGSDSFDLRDVPYIQYFHEGFALHGAYWHDEFGKARSHGCVNLAPADAAWLFGWTDPIVPPEWHGAVNLEGGTLVYTHA